MTVQRFLDKLVLRRHEKKMSQAELGKAAGVSRNYISMIERGFIDNVSFLVLAKICMALSMALTIDATNYEEFRRDVKP